MAGTQSIVFYVAPDQAVHQLIASAEEFSDDIEPTESRATYDDRLLRVDNKLFKSTTKDLAALSYLLGPENTTTRVSSH